jgi:hypothetical protein
MVGPLALLLVAGLNLWLMHRGWARLRPALLGTRALSTLVASRPDGECVVLAFPAEARVRRPAGGAASLRLAA